MLCKFCNLEIKNEDKVKVPKYPENENNFDYAHSGCWVLWSKFQKENTELKDLLNEVAIITNDVSIPTAERIKLIIKTYECHNYKELLGIK